MTRDDRRNNPRLKLSYPIEVTRDDESERTVLGRSVTRDVGPRGAYFSTFEAASYLVGQPVTVVLSVPHRLATGGEDVLLDLRGAGRVVRVEGPETHRTYGEDGATLSGVAIEFMSPLTFKYRWM